MTSAQIQSRTLGNHVSASQLLYVQAPLRRRARQQRGCETTSPPSSMGSGTRTRPWSAACGRPPATRPGASPVPAIPAAHARCPLAARPVRCLCIVTDGARWHVQYAHGCLPRVPARPAAELHASRGILPTLVALADGKRAWCRGPTGLLLNELADHSFNYAECRIIFVRAQAPC